MWYPDAPMDLLSQVQCPHQQDVAVHNIPQNLGDLNQCDPNEGIDRTFYDYDISDQMYSNAHIGQPSQSDQPSYPLLGSQNFSVQDDLTRLVYENQYRPEEALSDSPPYIVPDGMYDFPDLTSQARKEPLPEKHQSKPQPRRKRNGKETQTVEGFYAYPPHRQTENYKKHPPYSPEIKQLMSCLIKEHKVSQTVVYRRVAKAIKKDGGIKDKHEFIKTTVKSYQNNLAYGRTGRIKYDYEV